MEDLSLAFVAFGLVLLNGFFVAAEFAIVKLRRTRADEVARHAGLPGRVLLKVRSNLDLYLSACQLGITLASIGLGWIGEPAVARLLEAPLRSLGIVSEDVLHGAAFAIAFTLIAYTHIVLGELAPKSLAIRRPETLSLWTATPLFAFYWLMYPFIRVLNSSANAMLRLVGFRLAGEGESAHTIGELKQVLGASHRHGELEPDEARLLAGALELPDLTAGELMRPARAMIGFNVQADWSRNVALARKYRYSRYPVFDGDRSRVLGVVHMKDLWPEDGDAPPDLRKLARPALVVGRDESAARLLQRFREGASHFALVDDSTNALVGFVTLDHILEALLGGIRDEFHQTHRDWLQTGDGSFVGSGGLPLFKLERVTGEDFHETEVDTVAGFLMKRLDRVPREGDHLEFERFSLRVTAMRGQRVHRVRVVPRQPARPDGE